MSDIQRSVVFSVGYNYNFFYIDFKASKKKSYLLELSFEILFYGLDIYHLIHKNICSSEDNYLMQPYMKQCSLTLMYASAVSKKCDTAMEVMDALAVNRHQSHDRKLRIIFHCVSATTQ